MSKESGNLSQYRLIRDREGNPQLIKRLPVKQSLIDRVGGVNWALIWIGVSVVIGFGLVGLMALVKHI